MQGIIHACLIYIYVRTVSSTNMELPTESSALFESSQSSLKNSFQLSVQNLPGWFLALFALGYLMRMAAGLFVWVLCAVFLFALLDPLFEYLKSKRFPSVFAAFILVACTAFFAIVIIYLVFYFSRDIIIELEESKKILIEQYTLLQKSFSSIIDNVSHISGSGPTKDMITGKVIPKVEVIQSSPLSSIAGTSIVTGVGSAFAILTYFFLCPILTLFMMNEKKRLALSCAQIFSTPEVAAKTWQEICRVVQGFFLGNLVLFILTVPLFAITFKLFALPSILTLCILASLINVIPFVGAILTGILPALALLSQKEDVVAAFWLYLTCAFIHFFIANFVTPKILGSRLSINATVSTISLFTWGLLWGPMGLILAIPLTASLKALLKSSSKPTLQWIAGLFEKADPPLPRPRKINKT